MKRNVTPIWDDIRECYLWEDKQWVSKDTSAWKSTNTRTASCELKETKLKPPKRQKTEDTQKEQSEENKNGNKPLTDKQKETCGKWLASLSEMESKLDEAWEPMSKKEDNPWVDFVPTYVATNVAQCKAEASLAKSAIQLSLENNTTTYKEMGDQTKAAKDNIKSAIKRVLLQMEQAREAYEEQNIN